MRPQPTPSVTNEDVARVVRRDFHPENVSEVRAILAEYGPDTWHREPNRVRLAALKLASGSIEQLRREIETAKCDYRDVLAPAEYPGYSKRMFRIQELPGDEQQRIIDADWSQYYDWLTR